MKNLITISIIVLLFSCLKDKYIVENFTLNDWTEATHSNNVDPDYSKVFKQNEVIRFDIKISEADWNTMQDNLEANLRNAGPVPGNSTTNNELVWVPCSFYYNDIEWYKVGIRFKGNSSLKSTIRMGINKLSFKLDFDQFDDDYPEIKNQRFYGFKQLNLKNNFEDKSNMREKVASDLFYDFGIASPQTAFCVVYVDYGSGPVYFGVYTLVEEVDDTVLENQFESDEGNLYKPDGDAASFAEGTYNNSEMEKKIMKMHPTIQMLTPYTVF